MSVSLDGTTSPILSGNILNESVPKDEGEHLLQDLINDMNDQNFDTIRFASYRTAAKLQFIQRKTNLHLVDVYNMIEAFRENGLNTLDHNTELHELRLEAIVSSIFYALNKRLPTTHNVDVEKSISLVTNWLLYSYDSDAIGRIRVLSVKTALSSLCYGRLVDKLRYHFSQVEDDNGVLNFPKFEAYMRELLQLPTAVGEGPTFGFTEDVSSLFFRPQGPLKRQQTQLVNFLECVMNKDTPPPYAWLATLQKMNNSAKTEHQVACQVCKKNPVLGFRYKCLHCYNYALCQDCFWRGKVSQGHKTDHDLREYSTWNSGEKGSSLRSKLLCGSGKKKRPSLPDYPRDPEPNKTLDMTNIVPPLPSDLSGPNHATFEYVTTSPSPDSVGSTISSNPTKMSDECDPRMDDEHKLISRYAARLAANSRQKPPTKSSSELSIDANKEQRELIQTLENKNRLLLKEIRRLRDEHDEASKSAAQIAQNPELLAELKLLRQRKDELELRMSALQESRRELMVQLEGLMNLLKAGSPRVSRSPKAQHMAATPASDLLSKPPQTTDNPMSPDSTKLSGVDGDIKQAFGDQTSDAASGRNLRHDLLLAADSVTNAMSSLVKELNSEDEEVTSTLAKPSNITSEVDLDALEYQVTQMKQSLQAGDTSSPETITNGHGAKKTSAKRPLRRGDSDRTDTDTDDDEAQLRRGERKYSSRTQVTDDESYIQTDDDEGTLRTDDEDMEWQEAMKRWAHR